MIGATDISAPVGTSSSTTTTGDHRRPTDLLVGFFPLIHLYIFLGNHVHLPGLTSSEIRPKLSHPRFDLSQASLSPSLSLNQGLIAGKGRRMGERERKRGIGRKLKSESIAYLRSNNFWTQKRSKTSQRKRTNL